jgi:deoxyribodipyrimidine photolyase
VPFWVLQEARELQQQLEERGAAAQNLRMQLEEATGESAKLAAASALAAATQAEKAKKQAEEAAKYKAQAEAVRLL